MKRSQFEDDIESSAIEAEIAELGEEQVAEPLGRIHSKYLKEIESIKRLDEKDRAEALDAISNNNAKRKWWKR